MKTKRRLKDIQRRLATIENILKNVCVRLDSLQVIDVASPTNPHAREEAALPRTEQPDDVDNYDYAADDRNFDAAREQAYFGRSCGLD